MLIQDLQRTSLSIEHPGVPPMIGYLTKVDKGTTSLPTFVQKYGKCIMTAEHSAVMRFQTQLKKQNTEPFL